MWHYQFHTRRCNIELDEKIQEFTIENDGYLEVKKKAHVYEFNYGVKGSKELCDEQIAHIMSDIVQKQAIIKVCEAYLKEKEGLSFEEKKEIGEAFLNNNYLSRQEGFSYITYYLLYVPILNEIKDKQGFNIDGWIDFRINKYLVLLRDLLEQFLADYLSKKDVVSFIRLMREASYLAVPLEEIIHVVFSKEGKIMLFDEKHQNVTGHYVKKYCKELLLDSTLTREDYLLHVIITISPRKLVIHHKERMKDKKFINTLEIIFEDNVIYCTACDFCRTIE